jgi:hypothetical protein
MSKTDDRLDECYDAIRAALPNSQTDANNAVALLQRQVAAWPQRANLAKYLSLGSRQDKSATETQRRQAVRCMVLLELVVVGQPAGMAASLIARHDNSPLALLQTNIKANLPLFDQSPFRNDWDPANFSDHTTGAGDYDARVPNRQIAPFQYLCFGMMNVPPVAGTAYTDILADPTIMRQYLISTALVSNGKVATYYPYGLILSVPSDNIVSTNYKDQAVRNYNAKVAMIGETAQMTDLRVNDLRANVRAVTARFPILSPANILAGTTGTQGMRGYNEVVVLGSFGSKCVTPVAFFKKVNAAGINFIRDDSGATYLTPAIERAIVATGLPVIRLLDTSGLDQPKPGKT